MSACRWIAPFLGFGSPAILIRAGKLKDLTESDFMSRTQVAVMESQDVNRLHQWCLQILQREINSLKGLPEMDSAQEALLEVLPEVLSRLAFKVNASVLQESFKLALHVHQHPGIRAHIRLHEITKDWFERLFFAADAALLVEWIPALIKLPLFNDRVHLLIPEQCVWPDPMNHFPNNRVRGIQVFVVYKLKCQQRQSSK
jgi:hypothetical protein